MQKLIKINYVKYFLLSLLPYLLVGLFLTERNIRIGLLICYFSTCVNQILFVYVVSKIAVSDLSFDRIPKASLIMAFISKTVILFGGLLICVHFMGSKVIIALVNYVTQIFILAYCVKSKKEIL